MIHKVRIQNFKSLRDVSVELPRTDANRPKNDRVAPEANVKLCGKVQSCFTTRGRDT